MAVREFELKHGLVIGNGIVKNVRLREPTAGDVIEAQDESEKLVMMPDPKNGMTPTLVTSPARMGIEVLRRQILAIDDFNGPLDLSDMKRLHPEDLNLMQHEAEELEAFAAAEFASQAVSQRGRSDGDSEAGK